MNQIYLPIQVLDHDVLAEPRRVVVQCRLGVPLMTDQRTQTEPNIKNAEISARQRESQRVSQQVSSAGIRDTRRGTAFGAMEDQDQYPRRPKQKPKIESQSWRTKASRMGWDCWIFSSSFLAVEPSSKLRSCFRKNFADSVLPEGVNWALHRIASANQHPISILTSPRRVHHTARVEWHGAAKCAINGQKWCLSYAWTGV